MLRVHARGSADAPSFPEPSEGAWLTTYVTSSRSHCPRGATSIALTPRTGRCKHPTARAMPERHVAHVPLRPHIRRSIAQNQYSPSLTTRLPHRLSTAVTSTIRPDYNQQACTYFTATALVSLPHRTGASLTSSPSTTRVSFIGKCYIRERHGHSISPSYDILHALVSHSQSITGVLGELDLMWHSHICLETPTRTAAVLCPSC